MCSLSCSASQCWVWNSGLPVVYLNMKILLFALMEKDASVSRLLCSKSFLHELFVEACLVMCDKGIDVLP